MEPSDAITFIILILLLLLSAFFSSAETALTTANKLRIRSLADDNNKNAKLVLSLVEEPDKMLSAILICNNVINLSASSIATSMSIIICERLGLGKDITIGASIATAILTFLILVFGEITPKNAATKKAEKMSLFYARPISFFTWLLTPVIFIVNKISTILLILLRIDPLKKSTKITEDELRTIVDVSHEEGILESEEREMITNVVDFGDTLVKDVMVPRMDIEMVKSDISYNDLMQAFLKNKFARIPVYEDSIDDIVGIINLKDFFFYNGDKENLDIKSLLREAYFTYEYKNVDDLFREMRKDSIPMSIVLDEYGALAGLITMEDLVEEIVGELRDEYDTDEEDEIQKISETEYILLGNADLDDISKLMKIHIESDDYDSISGHIINILEHFPDVGEVAEDDYAKYTILATEGNRIDKIRMEIKSLSPSDKDEDTSAHSHD